MLIMLTLMLPYSPSYACLLVRSESLVFELPVIVTHCIQTAAQTRKTRIIDVIYNASNNELVRTKTLTKSTIIHIDATPFRQWYEAHYALPLGRKKGVKLVSNLRNRFL